MKQNGEREKAANGAAVTTETTSPRPAVATLDAAACPPTAKTPSSVGGQPAPPAPHVAKVRLAHLRAMAERGEKIVMTTAYDYPTAAIADAAGVEIVLVGDSLGNTILGLENTLQVTMEMMIHHCRAASRGVKRALLLADMPFMSYQVTPEAAVENAGRLVRDGGAEAVKLEGAGRRVEAIRRIVDAGIPVMGHLGLLPQSVHQLSGYRVQARMADDIDRLVQEAKSIQDAGAFALLVELTTSAATEAVANAVEIPLIGIGAGPACDGQVLVWHDLLGLRPDAAPRFCKSFAGLWDAALEGMRAYCRDVKAKEFPGPENEYH